MQVVLLERIEKLGQMGDVVTVKNGFARNFLLPRNKALRATKDNLARFETQRAQLEARNLELAKEAEQVKSRLDGKSFIILRQAGETGQLYGSVTPRDIAAQLGTDGFTTNRNQVALEHPIKTIGLHTVRIALHPEVSANVTVNVARSEEEASRQAAGEDLTRRTDDEDDEAENLEATEVAAMDASESGEEAGEEQASDTEAAAENN